MFGRKKRISPEQDRKPKPAPKASEASRVKGSLRSLEPRLMFDAAAAATAAEVNQEQVAQEQAESAVSAEGGGSEPTTAETESQEVLQAIATFMPAESRHEVAFVDPTVPNYQELLSGMDPNIEVIMLEGGQDGVEQMASALAGRTGIDAIHLISHGGAGALQLGTGTLTTEPMAGQYADELATIQQALSGEADILVYGCDFAEGDVGQAAVNQLAMLTGADVEASSDLTGNVALGGDWDLEVQTGAIETQVAINYDTQADWLGLLAGEAPPTITNLIGDSRAYSEGAGAVVIEQGGNALVADVDSANFDTGTLTVRFTAGSDSAEDFLSIRNQGTGAGQIGVSGSNVTYGGTTIGTFTGGSRGTDFVITLNSNATPTAVTALVKNISYQNTDTNAPTTGARTVQFVLTDGDGGTSANYDTTVTVNGVNDAPVLTDTVLTMTVDIDAGAPSGAVGSVVSAFTEGITDVDGGAAKGLAVIGSNQTNGTWYYTTNGGTTWTAVGTVSNTSALLLADNASTRLYFAPNANYAGTSSAALTVRAWDQTSGTAGTKVSTASTGGTTAFSTATDTIAVTVTAVNDAPTDVVAARYLSTLTPDAVSNLHGGRVWNDIGYGGSALKLDGVSFARGIATHAPRTGVGYVDYAISGATSFKATIGINDAFTGTYGSVIFKVYVDGALQYTSARLTSVSAPVDIDVNTSGGNTLRLEVNNAGNNISDHATWFNARLEGGTVGLSVAENSANGTDVGSVNRTDTDRGDNATYTLLDDAGGRFVINSSTGQVTVANGGLLNYEANTSHNITVRATDVGGLTYDKTLTINVTNVNEAPTGTDVTITISEDTSHTLTPANFGFSDVDAGDSLSAVRIDSLPSAGTLTLSGAAVTAGQVITTADITAGNLVFTPAADANGTGYASFTFSVRDSGNLYNSEPNTLTVNVTAVNDAPTITNLSGDSRAYSEGAGAVVIEQGGNALVADVDSTNFDTGTLTVSIPSGGDSAEDVLSIRNQGIGAGQIGVSGGALTYGGVTIGTFTGGSSGTDLVVTLNSNATPTAVTALVKNITYQNTDTDAPTTGARTVRFELTDGDGGTSASYDTTVTVTAVDDAPSFLAGDGVVTTAIGSSHDYGRSVTVQADGKILVAGQSSNGSNDDMALVRYQADGTLDTSFGGGDGIVTTAIGAGDDAGQSVTVQADGKILVAGYSHNGSNYDVALVRYNADGTLDTRFDLVNTLNGTPTFTEGGSPVVLDADVQIFDAELSTVNNFNGATLTLSRNGGASVDDVFSATGTLSLSGDNVVVSGTTIGTYTNSGGSLVLTFNSNATNALVNSAMQQIAYANASDAPPASVRINWTFSDGNSGSQGSGGALTVTGSTTVSITAVNDAPTDLSLSANTVAENVTNGTVVGTVTGTDPDAGDTKTYSFTNNAGGRFAINSATGVITVANSSLLDYESATSHSVTVRVTDSGGLTYDETFTITVTNVNEAPTGADATVTINEDTSHTLTPANFGFSDVDAGDSLSAVRIDTLPSAGTLTLSGAAVTAGQVITTADITAGNLVFAPAADANGTGYASFTFSVRDSNNAYDSSPNTLTFDVTAVNDAPVNQVPGAQTVNEDTALAISGINVTDVDGNLSTVQLGVLNGTVTVSLAGGATISGGGRTGATR